LASTVVGSGVAASEILEQKRKLRKSLFRWDLALFSICALVGIDTLGAVASFGTQTLFWLVFLSVFFLIPYGLITAELGTRFPVEGAVFEWVRLAFGHLSGAVTAMIYWVANPVWLGGTLAGTAVAAIDALWGTKISGNTGLSIAVGFLFIWIAVLMNVLSLRQMKWVPALGTVTRITLLVLFGLLVVGAIAGGHQAGSIKAGDLAPTLPVFIGVLGVLIFNFVGFELQSNASEEMGDPQRDVPRAVGVTWLVGALAYLIPVAGILLVLSDKDISNVGGFVDGYKAVVTNVLGGTGADILNGIVGLAVVFSLMAGGVVWLMGSDRAMAIASLAGDGPRAWGRFSKRFGTPVTVNIWSGILSTIFMAGTFLITSGNVADFFGAVLAVVISTTTFSYVLVFPAIIALRMRFGTRGAGFKIPGGLPVVVVCAVLAEFFVVGATVFSLWPGLFTEEVLNKVGNLERGTYELVVIGTMVVILLAAVAFWAFGRSRQTSAEYELVTAEGESLLKG
jgi:glutamate:GABA antiporter